MKLFTFSKKEHLCKRNDFQNIFLKGKSIHHFPFRCVYLVRPADKLQIKIGISVPKKTFKLAVKRNRIKRLIRETYRLNKHLLYESLQDQTIELLLLFIYTCKNDYTFKEMNKQINLLLNKIIAKDFVKQLKNQHIHEK